MDHRLTIGHNIKPPEMAAYVVIIICMLLFQIYFNRIIQCLQRLFGRHSGEQCRTLVAKYFSLAMKYIQTADVTAWVVIDRHIAQLATLEFIIRAAPSVALLIPLF